MNIGETLYLTCRADWRAWLNKHHKSKNEIWLIYYKKHTGQPRIPYDDAVEEALCYGWIDSTVRRIDDEKYAQKFTPRRKGSRWSDLNITRAVKMIRAGLMTEAGKKLFTERKNSDSKSLEIKPAKSVPVPPDLKSALSKNQRALNNFNSFAPSYRRLYILWVLAARRDETRAKRIKAVVERSAENIKPGML